MPQPAAPPAAPAKSFGGWAIRYLSPSIPLTLANGREVIEIFEVGAFAESVDAINAGRAQIEMNIEHEDNALCRIGLTGANLAVSNMPEGVWAALTIAGDSVSRDMFEKIKAGIVGGLSVEFRLPDGYEPAFELDARGGYVRRVAKAILTGIAVTVEPAYPSSRIVSVSEARTIRARNATQIVREVELLSERYATAGLPPELAARLQRLASIENQQAHYRREAARLGFAV
jgi:HK97 family phage prohead protease